MLFFQTITGNYILYKKLVFAVIRFFEIKDN